MSKSNQSPLFHNTLMLLKNYRDVIWSMDLSIQHIKSQFQIEYSSIDDFLESAQNTRTVSYFTGFCITLIFLLNN